MAAAAVTITVAAAGCGVVKIVQPEQASHSERRTATAWVDSCTLLQKPEVESALGMAVKDPELWLTGDGDNRDGNTCNWVSGRAGRVSTWADGGTHGPDDDDCGCDAEELDGIGRSAGLIAWVNSAQVRAHTDKGQGFTVEVAKVGATPEELRARAIELARLMVERVAAAYPGSPESLPKPPALDFEVCDLLPAEQRVPVTGWAARSDSEFDHGDEGRVGGRGGAGYKCSFFDTDFKRMMWVSLSTGPATAAEAAENAEPLPPDTLGRAAFYQPPMREEEVGGFGLHDAMLTAVLDDGRLLSVSLRDETVDANRLRDMHVQLMKVAVANLARKA